MFESSLGPSYSSRFKLSSLLQLFQLRVKQTRKSHWPYRLATRGQQRACFMSRLPTRADRADSSSHIPPSGANQRALCQRELSPCWERGELGSREKLRWSLEPVRAVRARMLAPSREAGCLAVWTSSGLSIAAASARLALRGGKRTARLEREAGSVEPGSRVEGGTTEGQLSEPRPCAGAARDPPRSSKGLARGWV